MKKSSCPQEIFFMAVMLRKVHHLQDIPHLVTFLEICAPPFSRFSDSRNLSLLFSILEGRRLSAFSQSHLKFFLYILPSHQ